MKRTKGYKNTIQDAVHKIGGSGIDRITASLYSRKELPTWIEELAKSFGKEPLIVAKDLITYRNSMGYQYRQLNVYARSTNT